MMMFIKSKISRALPLALLLATSSALSAVTMTGAQAWQKADWSQNGSDGSSVTLWYQKGSDGQGHFAVVIEKNGKVTVNIDDAVVDAVFDKINSGGDPGPDQSSDRGISKPDVVDAIKKGLVTYTIRVAPEDSPLVKWLERGGNGSGPRINPGDGGESSGPGAAPTVKLGGPTPAQIRSYIKAMNIAARELQQIGVAMGDVEGLSGEEAPGVSGHGTGRNGSGKNNGSGPNPDGNGKNKYLGSGFDSVGPRPQYVNPPHSSSRGTAKAGSSSMSASSFSAMNPGLLEGGSTFGSQGPSATGSPVGSSSRGSPSAAGIR